MTRHAKVRDLAPKLRCRERDVKGRAVVSIGGHSYRRRKPGIRHPSRWLPWIFVLGSSPRRLDHFQIGGQGRVHLRRERTAEP
jgi:hypothetical protein